MKILHTADWHLGKRLDHFSRLEEQVAVMDEIMKIADKQNVDMVLVAGDLFDNFNPSTEAVELFYQTLKRLTKGGTRPVIAISGNHDSPSLIDAPDPLARECGIVLIGHPKATVQPLHLEHFQIVRSDEGFIEIALSNVTFPVRILHTPYANEIRLKQYLGENKDDELNEVLSQHWKELATKYCDENGVNLLMAHLYMNKRGAAILEEPEGEKPIKIGNADMIYSDAIPTQIQYTALGHIHGFKNIGTEEKPVVYSSSPLCYSFSEAGQKKYVSIIDIQPNSQATFERIRLKKGKPLERMQCVGLDDALLWLHLNPDALVELTIETETFLKAEERKALYQAHQGIIHLIPKVRSVVSEEVTSKEINLNQKMDDLFVDYFKTKHANQEPNDDLKALFQEVLNS